MNSLSNTLKRRAVIVCIMVFIAAVHIFRVGSYLPKELSVLYYGYFSDILVPFGGYFLLYAAEQQLSFLRRWDVKLAAAFLIPAIAETCQYFGVPVFGSFFDPLDYVMYAVGVVSAVLVDLRVFPHLFDFWSIKNEKP